MNSAQHQKKMCNIRWLNIGTLPNITGTNPDTWLHFLWYRLYYCQYLTHLDTCVPHGLKRLSVDIVGGLQDLHLRSDTCLVIGTQQTVLFS